MDHLCKIPRSRWFETVLSHTLYLANIIYRTSAYTAIMKSCLNQSNIVFRMSWNSHEQPSRLDLLRIRPPVHCSFSPRKRGSYKVTERLEYLVSYNEVESVVEIHVMA